MAHTIWDNSVLKFHIFADTKVAGIIYTKKKHSPGKIFWIQGN